MTKSLAAFALTLTFVFAGCGHVKYPTYYTLNLAPPPDPAAKPGPLPSIAIRQFRSPAYLRQGPIMYRTTPEEIHFYEYHRWAADPRTLVSNAVTEYLRASGRYSSVTAYNGRDCDYVVSGTLDKLEETDYEGGVKVEVALSAQISRVEDGAIVWSNAVSETGTVAQRNVGGIVSQMNRSMESAIDKLLSTVPESLPANSAGNQSH